MDFSPNGVIATGGEVGCTSCQNINFNTVQYFGYPYCKYKAVKFLASGTATTSTSFCNDKPQTVTIQLSYSIDTAALIVNNQFCSLGLLYTATFKTTATSTITLTFDPVTLSATHTFPALTTSGSYTFTVGVSDSRFGS